MRVHLNYRQSLEEHGLGLCPPRKGFNLSEECGTKTTAPVSQIDSEMLDVDRRLNRLESRNKSACDHIDSLTPRQKQILALVLTGHPSKNMRRTSASASARLKIIAPRSCVKWEQHLCLNWRGWS